MEMVFETMHAMIRKTNHHKHRVDVYMKNWYVHIAAEFHIATLLTAILIVSALSLWVGL
jgi:hypothetical protein